jgi:hypothetical protein
LSPIALVSDSRCRLSVSETTRALVAVALIANFAAGCAKPNDRDRLPSIRVTPSNQNSSDDTIAYRELEHTDFKARRPPRPAKNHARDLGAVTCASIIPNSGVELVVLPNSDGSGHWVQLTYLEYRAEMDRSCSWWNPKWIDRETQAIRDHEQVHFGLAEFHARAINLQIRALRILVDDRETAASRATEELVSILRFSAARLREENVRFDKESAEGDRTEVASRWRTRVERRLGISQ